MRKLKKKINYCLPSHAIVRNLSFILAYAGCNRQKKKKKKKIPEGS